MRGQESLSNLTEVERYRFDLAFTMWLKSVEQAFADYRDGNFSASYIIAYKNSVPASLTTAGGAEWWQERQVWFGPAFGQEVAELCSQPPSEAGSAGPPKASAAVAQ